MTLATGWSQLVEPTYAVSRDGEARRLCVGTGQPGVELENRYPGCPVCRREFSAQGRKAQARMGNPWRAIPRHYARREAPAETLSTGWNMLAAPTYAVSRDGEARRLEAGTYLAPLAEGERDGRLPGMEVQVWTEPEWPYYERPVSFWFVHGPALRFGEVG